MAKRKEDAPAPGAPAWMATFGDLMNLLLCFFVLLFSMSSVDAQKFEMIAASFAETFSIFSGGAMSIGDGILMSNGVSQLSQLDDYMTSMGKAEEGEEQMEARNAVEEEKLERSEQLAEKIEESLKEQNLSGEVEIDFNSQYVELTLKGAFLFDSGSAQLKEEALPILDQVGILLERYAESIIEIEGHTDNVPVSPGSRFADNNELSGARALSVFNYFLDTTSLPPAIIKHSGRGEYVPVADNATPEGRAKNRRVVIKIYHALSAY